MLAQLHLLYRHLWLLHHLMRLQLTRVAFKNGMHLNSHAVEEMQWWHNEMHKWSSKVIISARCHMVIMTDASSLSFGGSWRPFGHSSKLKDQA